MGTSSDLDKGVTRSAMHIQRKFSGVENKRGGEKVEERETSSGEGPLLQ